MLWKYKGKVDYNILEEYKDKKTKINLVTAINPTQVAKVNHNDSRLGDALNKLGKNCNGIEGTVS